MAGLEDLERLIGPGEGGPPVDWDTVENRLGLSLPIDYKRIADRYGPGVLSGFLTLFHPGTDNGYVNLVEQANLRVGSLAQLEAEGSEVVPYGTHVGIGGLLAWGATDNGDVCFWSTRTADARRWSIVVNESRGPEWEEYECALPDFLFTLLTGAVRVPFFPDDVFVDEPYFERYD